MPILCCQSSSFPAVRPAVAPFSAVGVRTAVLKLHGLVLLLSPFALCLWHCRPFSFAAPLCHAPHLHGVSLVGASAHLGFQEADDLVAHLAHVCELTGVCAALENPSPARGPRGCRPGALFSCCLTLCDRCIDGRAIPSAPFLKACPTLCIARDSAHSESVSGCARSARGGSSGTDEQKVSSWPVSSDVPDARNAKADSPMAPPNKHHRISGKTQPGFRAATDLKVQFHAGCGDGKRP